MAWDSEARGGKKMHTVRVSEGGIRRRNKELAFLIQMSEFLSSLVELRSLLDGALERVMKFFSLEAGRIYLEEEGIDHLTLQASKGMNTEGLERIHVSEGFTGKSFRTKSFISKAVGSLEDKDRAALLMGKGLRSIVCVPLINANHAVGVMNLMVIDHQVVAADARVEIAPSAESSPDHLVISPYPAEHERVVTTAKGRQVFIRPIKPEDAAYLEGFVGHLSRRSVYYRFFSPLRRIPKEIPALYTQVDYDRDISLVAFDTQDMEDGMRGVARIVRHPGEEEGELAVLVGDPWQGQGIGAALLDLLIEIARGKGMSLLWGTVPAENTQMIDLAKRSGFSLAFQPGENAYRIELDLRKT